MNVISWVWIDVVMGGRDVWGLSVVLGFRNGCGNGWCFGRMVVL